VATILDAFHVDVRAGHHCAQPLLKYMGTMSTTRASIAFYNTEHDVDRFIDALKKVRGEMGIKD
jgi:cysteine desulfurase/selenocysteine lyase